MFSCFSLLPSPSPPEDGFSSFPEKRKKGKRGRPPSVQDRHFPVFLLGKLSFSSLLRNASPCHPLRREKEKKEIAMPSESVVRREESPSFLLFPPEGRFRHFSKKRKERKDGSIEIRHHGWRRFQSAEERKKEKSERKESSCLPGAVSSSRPWEKTKRKGKPSPVHRGESPLAFLSEKKKKHPSNHGQRAEEKEEKRSTVLSLPPFLFRMLPLPHSSKRREAVSHRYAGRSKR